MARVRLSHVAAVAAGGAIGATLRVLLADQTAAASGAFPVSTFAANIVGAFVLGALVVALPARLRNGQTLYLVACTGVLGSFTTFSTFSMEVAELGRQGSYALALVYPLASIAVGLAAALAGMRGARALVKRRADATRGGAR